jgi:hypothetical protein
LRQEYSVRPKPEIPCAANDCSSWPSASTRDFHAQGSTCNTDASAESLASYVQNRWAAPQARDYFPPHSEERIAAMKAHGHGMRNLNDEAATWHAPRANDPEKRGEITDDPRNGIAGQAENWAAPRTSDTNGAGAHGDGGLDLRTQADQWMAPNVPNGGRTASHAEMVGNTLYHGDKKVQLGLEHQAKAWAAPAARDHKGSSEGSVTRQDGKSRADMLDYQAEQFFRLPSSQDQPIAGGSTSSTAGPSSNQPSQKRKLNPIFVEALMRWPTGLSGFERQETAWTRWWLLMPSFVSTLCSPVNDPQADLFGEAA